MRIFSKDQNGFWDTEIVPPDFDEIYGFCLDICEENDFELGVGVNKIPEGILIQFAKRMKNLRPDNKHGVSVKNELISWYENITNAETMNGKTIKRVESLKECVITNNEKKPNAIRIHYSDGSCTDINIEGDSHPNSFLSVTNHPKM